MNAYAPRISQQEKYISGAVAASLHLLFLALLVFGINWQRKIEPPVNIVDLWAAPTAEAPVEKPAPEPEPPPPPVARPEPKVIEPPPAKVIPKPEVAKPDIAFKEKVEKEKAEKERAEKDKRAADEKKQKDAKKKEDDARKAQAAEAAEAQRAANEQAEAQRRVVEQAAASQARLIADFKERIRVKIQKEIILPPSVQGNAEAEFDVVLLSDGNPLNVKLKRSSGNTAYDNAVERAIQKAKPLPLPPDQTLFRHFRELNLAFRPQQ